MKKKIKDLTLQEVMELCEKYRDIIRGCDNCPLRNPLFDRWGGHRCYLDTTFPRNWNLKLTDFDMDKEIEV